MTRRWGLFQGIGLAAALTLGCANPGPPRPPSLYLPEFAGEISTKRAGDEITVSWSTPAKTTDGLLIRGTIVATICRQLSPAISTAKSIAMCQPIRRIVVAPGPAEVIDKLPADLSTGAAMLLAYRIELSNSSGRSAGRSEPVYAAGGAAPPPVGLLTISARRGAALIQWQAAASPLTEQATIELHRRHLNPASTGEQTESRSHQNLVTPTPARNLLSGSDQQATDLILTVAAKQGTNKLQPEASGTLDTTVRDGDSYVYVAQRVTKVTLQGKELEVRGLASPPAPFTYQGIFPPGVPSGLVSVPGAGLAGAPSIDLSWEPNTEKDLLGYNVYRRVDSGVFARLNVEPLHASFYRDLQVTPGHNYSYRVTAIDRHGNESAPGGEIRESLRR